MLRAPPVRCNYLVHVARFMLGAVGLLETRWGIKTVPAAVSPAEGLDSLLHLVDRYAHVELLVLARSAYRYANIWREVSWPRSACTWGSPSTAITYGTWSMCSFSGICSAYAGSSYSTCQARELLANFVESEVAHPPRDVQPDDARLSPDGWLRDWAVAALLHDIGYQIVPASSTSIWHEWRLAYFALPGAAISKWLSSEPQPGEDESLGQLCEGVRGEGARGQPCPRPLVAAQGYLRSSRPRCP